MRWAVQRNIPLRDETYHLELQSAWLYTAADPWAVTVAISLTSAGPAIYWSFARQLVAEGAEGPAGLGDVQLWPHYGRTALRLISPDGEFIGTVQHRQLLDFLADTYDLVPPGREHHQYQLDEAVAGLLTTGGEPL